MGETEVFVESLLAFQNKRSQSRNSYTGAWAADSEGVVCRSLGRS
jgi:hypothetical protein